VSDLHPKTLAALEAGPLKYEGNQFGPETPHDFARRIALIEQEECEKDILAKMTLCEREIAAYKKAEAIRRRGKP